MLARDAGKILPKRGSLVQDARPACEVTWQFVESSCHEHCVEHANGNSLVGLPRLLPERTCHRNVPRGAHVMDVVRYPARTQDQGEAARRQSMRCSDLNRQLRQEILF